MASTYFLECPCLSSVFDDKGKQIESSAGPSGRDFLTKGNKLEASAERGGGSGILVCSPGSLQYICFRYYWIMSIPVCMHVFHTYWSSDAYYDRKIKFWPFSFSTHRLSKEQPNIDALDCFGMVFEPRLRWADLRRRLFCDKNRFREWYRAYQFRGYICNISIK